MEEIRDIDGLDFREIPNPDGDIGDSITLMFESREKTKKFVKQWMQAGFSTKNLPDAVDWHFAATWDHILHNYKPYKGKNLIELFKKSDDILRRSVALPILVNMTDNDINKNIKTIKEIANKI
jgi:dTDP-4-amino-4,6-dideoxygalactose transaminase